MWLGIVGIATGALAVIVAALSQQTVNLAAAFATNDPNATAFEPKLMLLGGVLLVGTSVWLLVERKRAGERRASLAVLAAAVLIASVSLYISAYVYMNLPEWSGEGETRDFTLILLLAIGVAIAAGRKARKATS